MARKRLKATIIIPTWNAKELLKACLPALQEAITVDENEHEIIVVDNASDDGSADYIHENFPQIKVIRLEKNLMFCGASNIGAEQAKNNVVIFLNNDMVVDKNFLRPLLDTFADDSTFAVEPQIFISDLNKPRWETGITWGKFENSLYQIGHITVDEAEVAFPILYAGAGAGAFDKEKFLKLGGFDKIFHPFYWEDVDICYRAWKRGWKSLYQPLSIVHHQHRGTISRTYSEHDIQVAFEKNRLLFMWKNLSNPRWLLEHLLFLRRLNSKNGKENQIMREAYDLASKHAKEILKQRMRPFTFPKLSDKKILKHTPTHLHASNAFRYRETNRNLQPVKDSSKMNILFVTPFFPYPPAAGGQVRMYKIIRGLSERHNVTLLSFDIFALQEKPDITKMERYCKHVYVLPCPWKGYDDHLLPTRPRRIFAIESDEMQAKISEILGTQAIDILQIDYTEMGQYVVRSKEIVTALTEHDVSFVSWSRRLRQVSTNKEKFDLFFEFLRLINYELKICKKFDVVLTVTEKEKQTLQSYLPRQNISALAPTGVDTAFFKPDNNKRSPNSLLYLGHFPHTPNVDSLYYFYNKIFPLIREEVPDVRLTIAGSSPPPEVVALNKDKNVNVTGYVEDIRPFLWDHSIFVAPIRIGAGVRVKILEAMAAEIPIVSTSIGCEGIPVNHREHLMIADSPQNFALETINLLKKPQLAEKLTTNARRLVEDKYDWKGIVSNLEHIYRELLVKKRGIESYHSPLA